MSGSVPGAPWGNTLNQLARPRYVVKARKREQRVVKTVKGPRRVWRWSEWREVERHATEEEAWAWIKEDTMNPLGSGEALAIFFGGKRVDT